MARFAPETAASRLARRARYLLSRVVGNRLRNSQWTRFVTRNGCRFKHPIFSLCGTLSYGAWTKPYFFEKKWKRIWPETFDRFCEQE